MTSTSLSRLPASTTAFVRGKSGNSPFLPGGLEDIVKDDLIPTEADFHADGGRSGQMLLKIPPGFIRGIRLPGEEPEEGELDATHTFGNISDFPPRLSQDHHVSGAEETPYKAQ